VYDASDGADQLVDRLVGICERKAKREERKAQRPRQPREGRERRVAVGDDEAE
jgi:hypothetical protein